MTQHGPTTANNAPSVSILIATRNRPEDLVPCLKSLLEQDTADYEIVVFDQSTSDASEQAVRAAFGCPANLRYLRSDTVGKSIALNSLLESARGERLVFTDDDTQAPADWLSAFDRAFQETPEADIVFGQVHAAADVRPGEITPAMYFSERRFLKSGEIAGMGANMAMRRAVLERVFGFDTRLGPGTDIPAAEEGDFIYRVQRAGGRILLDPHVVLIHLASRTEERWMSVLNGYGRGDAAFAMKHLRCGDWKMLGKIAHGLGYFFARGCLRIMQRKKNPSEFYYVRGYWNGLWSSLKYPVDRRTRLYHAPQAEKGN